MDWKAIVKPIAKFAFNFGKNFGYKCACERIKKHPDKGEQICADVAALGDIVKSDAEALAKGEWTDADKKTSDDKCSALIDRLFEY